MCLYLPDTLAAWPKAHFAATLEEELLRADPVVRLRLDRLLHHGTHVVGTPRFIVLGSEADAAGVQVRLGVFLRSVLAGCACADDPTPMDTMDEYGELVLRIDRASARVDVERQE